MSKQAKKSEVGGYVVIAPFRDKNDFDISYEVGQDVSHLDAERIEELVKKGLVK